MNIEILVSCMRARISPCTHLHEYQPAQMCEYTCAMCEIVTNSFCAVLPMQGLRVKKIIVSNMDSNTKDNQTQLPYA